jgi:hypothetical protein
MLEIMALMKPVQLKESSVRDAIDTPGQFRAVNPGPDLIAES